MDAAEEVEEESETTMPETLVAKAARKAKQELEKLPRK